MKYDVLSLDFFPCHAHLPLHVDHGHIKSDEHTLVKHNTDFWKNAFICFFLQRNENNNTAVMSVC